MTRKIIFTLFLLFAANSFSQENPQNSAIYNVKAEISQLKNRTLVCKVRDHSIIVDQPKEFGADNLGPTPPEMLSVAYGSCVISTMQLLALQRNLAISNIRVTVEGQIDFSKALGISEANRAGFSGLHISIKFDSYMTKEEKKSFINDVLKVGAAIDNIDNPTPVSYEIID
ncbi:OsmC family protein [Prevotella sp. 10(H)]|uniref:OsmC family protein n=1 Tax=Prevotella sp. 10(H) TaxID=1158294 RepID=UPI0004A6E8D3|nr:OsmC family protein [Prevotella sp. 10(H)]